MTCDNTKPFRIVSLNMVCLLSPVDSLEGIMRGRNHLRPLASLVYLVSEGIVGYSHYQAFVQIRPGVEGPLTDHALGDIGSLAFVVLGRDGNDHRLVTRVRLEDVDSMMSECALMRKGLE